MRRRQFSNTDKMRLFKGLIYGMAWLHKQNITHRDLKPSNIMIDKDGNPIIIDFGLAK